MLFQPVRMRVHLLLILLVAVEVGIAACTLQVPIATEAAASLKGRRIALTARPSPPFLPGGYEDNPASYGLVGLAVVSEVGAQIVRDNGISDPARFIARKLSDDLERRYDLKPARQTFAGGDDDPTKFNTVDPSADVVLDVWTGDWSLRPRPDAPPKYRVGYAVHLRLIDARVVHVIDGKKGAVIAEGTCRFPEDASSAHARDEFLADGARRLKDELDVAARFCVDEFRTKIFKAGPAR
jgi:hypothetical protein